MNRRLVSFFLQHRTCFNKRPCAIRVIIQCKFLLFSIFLQNELALKHTGFCSFGYFHAFFDILSDLVRTEIQNGQIVQAIERKHKYEKERIHRNHPCHLCRNKTNDLFSTFEDRYGCNKQYYILAERFPVCQHPCITETTAIGHRIR